MRRGWDTAALHRDVSNRPRTTPAAIQGAVYNSHANSGATSQSAYLPHSLGLGLARAIRFRPEGSLGVPYVGRDSLALRSALTNNSPNNIFVFRTGAA